VRERERERERENGMEDGCRFNKLIHVCVW
jgi:hypothetical protein